MTAILRLNFSRTIAILIFIASAALLIHPVFALDATPSATRKDRLEQKIDTRKENMASKITTMKEKMASREAAMKVKLQAFKDKKKAEVAERVNTNLNRVNQNQADQMQKHLDKMSSLLDKLEARVNKGTTDIKDPAGAKAAIAEARAKIVSASSAVKSQGEKDYTITVTTETKIRADAQAKREELYKDIKSIRQQVIDARQSVSNAVRVVKGGTVMKEGTTSGQQ